MLNGAFLPLIVADLMGQGDPGFRVQSGWHDFFRIAGSLNRLSWPKLERLPFSSLKTNRFLCKYLGSSYLRRIG